MPRPRRNLGPQQNPRNLGLNRNASVRGNNRRQNAFSPRAQGGLVQNPGISQAPAMQAPPPPQGQLQCPTGQIAKPGPDGKPTCMPINQGPRRPGGAGVPTGIKPPANKVGY